MNDLFFQEYVNYQAATKASSMGTCWIISLQIHAHAGHLQMQNRLNAKQRQALIRVC